MHNESFASREINSLLSQDLRVSPSWAHGHVPVQTKVLFCFGGSMCDTHLVILVFFCMVIMDFDYNLFCCLWCYVFLLCTLCLCFFSLDLAFKNIYTIMLSLFKFISLQYLIIASYLRIFFYFFWCFKAFN